MMPSSNDLTYFIEVASASNLSRAAERLGISQPSLSVAIQRLEQAIGTSLLIRSKKGVTLTQAGKQCLAQSLRLIQGWEAVRTQALASVHCVQGVFRIGCHASVALYSLQGFLPALLERNPLLEIKLIHDLSRKITESVIRMELDVGIVVNAIRHPDLVIRKLCDDEVTCWVGKGNHKTQDFRSGDAVLVCDPELLQSQSVMRKLTKSGIRFRRVLETSSLELVAQLTAAGAGIGIIPGRVASTYGLKSLRKLPQSPVVHDEISMLYRIESKGVRSVQVIAESIAAEF